MWRRVFAAQGNSVNALNKEGPPVPKAMDDAKKRHNSLCMSGS